MIGVAGGSGSGKTTVIQHIVETMSEEKLVCLQHDAYYRDLKHLPFKKRSRQNFDHHSSLETELLILHIKALKEEYQVEVPIYNFTQHVCNDETRLVEPKRIILLDDSILIFSEKKLRKFLDIKLFVDTDDDVRLLRHILERERSIENVLNQYEQYVRPMHLEFIEPSKRYTDIIIKRDGENEVALDMVKAVIQERLTKAKITN